MWETFFGLKERIFTPAADAKLPLTPTQLEARREIVESLRDGHHLVLLVGERGVGKSRLLANLAHDLASSHQVVWTPPGVPHDVASLYQALLFDLGLPWFPPETVHPPTWETTCRLRFGEWFLAQSDQARSMLIIADDVHDWPEVVLSEWRQVVQFNLGSAAQVQVVLAALPSLFDRLASGSLAAWADSVGYCVWLDPLSPEQAREHLSAVVARAGPSLEHLMEPQALHLLLHKTRGILRLMHQAMLRALQLAYSSGSKKIQTPYVIAALEELGVIADDSSARANSSAA